jgi:iron complex outermembrane receptor protein
VNAEYKQLLATVPVFCVGCTPTVTAVADLNPDPVIINQPSLAGNTPPITPAWTISLGYDKEIDLGSAGTLTASVFSIFKSAYFNDIFNFRDSRQEAFTQTDLSLMWQPESRQFSVRAFVRNLENSRPITYAGFTAAGNDRIYNWQFAAPRTYGVQLGFDF